MAHDYWQFSMYHQFFCEYCSCHRLSVSLSEWDLYQRELSFLSSFNADFKTRTSDLFLKGLGNLKSIEFQNYVTYFIFIHNEYVDSWCSAESLFFIIESSLSGKAKAIIGLSFVSQGDYWLYHVSQ
jgi:hypothetical protein